MSENYGRASYDFANAVAVVTGGASGIGAEVVAHLRRCGARVAVWDMAALADDDAWKVDVTDLDSVERAAQEVVKRFGRIDFAVNSAGFAGPTMPLDAYDPLMWRRIVDVNLVGTFNVCRAVVPHLRAAGAGRIVNIASLAGKEGTPNASAYSAAKAGVLALTKSLGKELATTGILVNAIAPAAVHTPILAQMSPAHVQTMIDKSPMQRLGESIEVAEMVAWLCSGSCTFNTASVFDLSGGRATY
ncbi:SDR family NAD(P)-dependent oxidoreductase [Variovorax sp. J22R115]|uniref:SDR family NAD(P)-dependent oxidoreductase n=1 Tax=Variovorax sp. J22R115 TaxID=3053509 RepID=UPI002577D0A9|nr:SDR family NAD(P)-dependent oxidoreductase [Variovorax sp. J22R115]MDM0048151.1 SDR family NAD(P)-dependent oxidoreductase [Variovorax sp. J22R115]